MEKKVEHQNEMNTNNGNANNATNASNDAANNANNRNASNDATSGNNDAAKNANNATNASNDATNAKNATLDAAEMNENEATHAAASTVVTATANSTADAVAMTTKLRNRFNYRVIERCKEFGFAVPALAFLIVFIFYPITNSIYLSFTDWNMVRPVKNWVGMENYLWLFESKQFGQVLKVTFTYTVLDVVLTLGFGLLFALLFNKTTKLFGFMRVIVFMPYYISMIIAAMVFLWIFNNNYGLANRILEIFGMSRVEWLTNPDLALWPLIIVSVWKGVGFAMILFIAGIRSIPMEYFEASSIDGASRTQQFFKITLPLLSPITLFLVITNFISSMQVFQSIDIMTNGGPLNATNAIVFWIFTMAFNDFRIGRASALIVIFFIIIIVLTVLQFLISKKRVHYEG